MGRREEDGAGAKDYYIGIFTVTQKQYTNLGQSNPSQMTKEKTGDMVAHRPVERLSPTFHVRVQKGRISWETGCRSSLHFCFLRCGVA